MRRRAHHFWISLPSAVIALAICLDESAGCPFCRSVSETLSDRWKIADVVVVARALPETQAGGGESPAADADVGAPSRKRRYRVVQVLKDGGLFGENRVVNAPPPMRDHPGPQYVIMGAQEIDVPDVFWDSPRPVSDAGIAYLRRLPDAPEKGADRLAYFQEFLNHPDGFIADDAYDEIARSDFADVKALGPRMHRDKLLAWVADRSVSALRRRQYLTMLSVCGRPEDAPLLEKLLLAEQGGPEGALDATAACYLTLTGEKGLKLIEERFIKNPQRTRSDGQAIAAALRFHGEEESVIPRAKLFETLRLYLDRPAWADQVMPELARWEDWSLVDRMVKLFHQAEQTTDGELASHALRVPIVKYLQVCPRPAAAERLAELEKSHPRIVKAAAIYPYLAVRSRNTEKESPRRRKSSVKQPPESEALPRTLASNHAPAEKTEESLDEPVRAPDPAPDAEDPPEAAGKTAVSKLPPPDPKKYPVALTAALLLGLAAVLFGLLLLILLGFRPRG